MDHGGPDQCSLAHIGKFAEFALLGFHIYICNGMQKASKGYNYREFTNEISGLKILTSMFIKLSVERSTLTTAALVITGMDTPKKYSRT